MTNVQIDAFRQFRRCFLVDPVAIAEGHVVAAALQFARENLGDGPILIHSSASPQEVSRAQKHLGQARAAEIAAVHLHSTYATALSCLEDLDDDDVLPPLTAYFVMSDGRLVRLPYFAPGDQGLARTAQEAATSSRALLLANHGPIVSAPSLAQAGNAVEEVEETARLFFLLQGHATRPLLPAQIAQLSAART